MDVIPTLSGAKLKVSIVAAVCAPKVASNNSATTVLLVNSRVKGTPSFIPENNKIKSLTIFKKALLF